jgi:hypothetical protein
MIIIELNYIIPLSPERKYNLKYAYMLLLKQSNVVKDNLSMVFIFKRMKDLEKIRNSAIEAFDFQHDKYDFVSEKVLVSKDEYKQIIENPFKVRYIVVLNNSICVGAAISIENAEYIAKSFIKLEDYSYSIKNISIIEANTDVIEMQEEIG